MARFGSWLALATILITLGTSPGVSSADEFLGDEAYYDQLSASESYYTLNVDEGSMTVRVEMTVQSAGGELATVFFWAMPAAENAVITIDGVPLDATFTPGIVKLDILSHIQAPLPTPIVGAQRVDVVLEYEVAPHLGSAVRMEPGLIELAFTGQGVGSFVLLDLPLKADNYVDPGCVLAADQPAAIKDAGFERYVCGESALAALNADDPEVLQDCARLDERCRQRLFIDPYSAYLQSVTDESKRGVLEADVVLGERTVRLKLLYFLADSVWAEAQFAVAQRAFLLLEELFGFEYPFDSLTMRESHKLAELGYAGLAFPTQGELLLIATPFFAEEVTVHEIAHQWAGFNLDHPWLWEGQAEWATEALARELGIGTYDRGWEASGYTDPLATWFISSEVTDANYWYGKAGAFWKSYEAAIGTESMGRVLAATDDDPSLHPLNGRWFMDRAELESGENLDELFLEWVWVELIARDLVEERRAAWDTVAPLRERLEELEMAGLPIDIQTLLDAWTFGGVASRTADSFELLDSLADVETLAAAEGLPPVNAVAARWSSLKVKELTELLESQRQTILRIAEAEEELSDQPQGSPSQDALEEARGAYAQGDFTEAAGLAAAAVANLANARGAERMIAIATERQGTASADFFSRVGLLFSDPDGDLAAAEQALAEGDAATAVQKSRAAYEAWGSARSDGMKLLAIIAGVLAALSVGGWFGLHRLSNRGQEPSTRADTDGHFLEERTSKVNWREWEKGSKGDDS